MRSVSKVLTIGLVVVALAFALLWQLADRHALAAEGRAREAEGILRDFDLRARARCDSVVRKVAQSWRSVALAAEAKQSVLIGQDELDQLRWEGLTDPVGQLRSDLQEHPELIPFPGVLGGTMRFSPAGGDIAILSGTWVFARFEDGHVSGECLLAYTVGPRGKIRWKVVASRMD